MVSGRNGLRDRGFGCVLEIRAQARISVSQTKAIHYVTGCGDESGVLAGRVSNRLRMERRRRCGEKGLRLYVKAIGSETMLRLTHHPSESIDPAWSPDGTQIA